MIARRVKLENFLSFGSPASEIIFEDGEALWVITGPNGVGKSSIFDAITYALFGCHRGGQSKVKPLIRHGANGLHVEFDFGFHGLEYRISRSYFQKSVERIFRHNGTEWIELDLNGVTVRDWVEDVLGLSFEQFTASVLLRQGEADKIITGQPKDRLILLKRIIGIERYENLSTSVHEAHALAKAQREEAGGKLRDAEPVSEEQLTEATQHVTAAELGLAARREEEQRAGNRVVQARQYVDLKQKLDELVQRLHAADARHRDARTIRERHRQFIELDTAVPLLTELLRERSASAKLQRERDQLAAALKTLTQQVEAGVKKAEDSRSAAEKHRLQADQAGTQIKDHQQSLKDDTRELQAAEAIDRLNQALAQLPADLDALVQASQSEQAEAELSVKRLSDELLTAKTLLDQKTKELEDFSKVGAGARCSRCRQTVTAEHAERERKELQTEIAKLRKEWQRCQTEVAAADKRLQTAKAAHTTRTAQVKERDKLQIQRSAVVRQESTVTSAALRTRIAGREAQLVALQQVETDERKKMQAQQAGAQKLKSENETAQRQRDEAQNQLRTKEIQFTEADTKVKTLSAQLKPDWPRAATEADLKKLRQDWDQLKAGNIRDEYRQLEEDEIRRSEWESRRKEAEASLNTIPADAHIPVEQAEADLKSARTATAAATQTHDEARQHQRQLQDNAQRYQELLSVDKSAETSARIHDRLDELLGSKGLLRDLVRDAERQIAQFADETVRHLSDGDLSITLDESDSGPDKAFTLNVRRAGDAQAIGVAYLSGSQKFRVAVAVALAIGRFAAHGNLKHPLESVIIDEGFGSLDQNGLRCMADELTRLKDKFALKRIILVSHQEEFVKRFPVGWRLFQGDNGTIAEKFRRQ